MGYWAWGTQSRYKVGPDYTPSWFSYTHAQILVKCHFIYVLNLVKIIGRISDSLDDLYDPFSRHGFSSRTQLRLLYCPYFFSVIGAGFSTIKVFTKRRYIGLSFERKRCTFIPKSLFHSFLEVVFTFKNRQIAKILEVYDQNWSFCKNLTYFDVFDGKKSDLKILILYSRLSLF